MKKVPNHDRIYARSDGKIYSDSGCVLNEYINGDGYRTVLVSENGKFSTKGVHRLVAMAYHRTEQDTRRLLVNHLDLDKSNNRPGNVVWATVLENNTHAALMGVNSTSDRIIANKGDEYISFKDCYALAVYLDIEVETAYRIVTSGRQIEGWGFRHRPSGKAIPRILHRANIHSRNKLGQVPRKPVSVVDIYSREVMEFDSIASAGRYFNVPTHFISQRVSDHVFKLYNLNWMIFYGSKKDVPELTPEVIVRVMRGKKRPLICKLPDGNVVIYTSVKEFYTDKGLSRKAITSRLAKDGTATYAGYTYAYAGTTLSKVLLDP